MSQLRVTQQFANDVITTAVEGGIGYWAGILNYKWKDRPETTAEIIETEASNPDGKRIKALLDLELVQKGIDRFLQPGLTVHASHVGRILASAVDPENADFDANDADLIIQAGVFGEIIYG